MRTTAQVRWVTAVAVWSVSVACSGGSDVEASEGPAGFVSMDAAQTANPPATEATAPAPAPVEARPKTVWNGGASDVPLAAALVHLDSAALRTWLAGDGASLPEERRQLALALSLCANGGMTEAKRIVDDLDEDELSVNERALLEAAFAPSARRAVPAAYGAEDALALAMDMALRERDGKAALRSGDVVSAAAGFSTLMQDELGAPWEGDPATLARWNQSLAEAQRAHRWNVRGKWPSISETVKKGDSLTVLRKRVLAAHPELLICTGLIARANQLKDDNALKPGDVLRIPTERAHVLVDISSRWMLYMHGAEVAAAFEIGVGRDGHDTPVGTFTVGPKQKNPMWFPKGAKPIPFGDPENPLGTRWIPWMQDGVKSEIGFHGTNVEAGVGGRVSQGCVRLRNVDAELIFDILPEGAEIRVQP